MLSITLTFGEAFSLASTVINDLLPVYLLPLGISLGILILGMIFKALQVLDIGRGRF